MKRVFVVTSLLMTGCASSQFVAEFEPESPDFAIASNLELCRYIGQHLPDSDDAKQELVKRDALTEQDWYSIESRQLILGNSECVVWAIWGNAFESKQINAFNRFGDVQSQVTYSCQLEGIDYCPFTTIIFVNDVVADIIKED